MGGRQVCRGHGLGGWVSGGETDQLHHRGNPEGAEPEEVLRLPGGLFRALLSIPHPLEEPKTCRERLPESSLELRGRWIKPLQEQGILVFH